MLNVLIIDDEEPLREAIRILGDWKSLGVEEVLEAVDGRSGLDMLRSRKIDIALVDMKMPELGGAEFLQIAEREFPDLLTIVISGYNDFEYTRQAIRSKVVDYLLKPVNRIDLNTALRKAVDVLEAKRRKESEFISRNITLNMSLPKLKEKLYLSIIRRTFKASANEGLLPLIGGRTPGSRYAAGLVRIMNLDAIARGRFNGDRDLLHFAVTNVIGGIGDDGIEGFSFAAPGTRGDRDFAVILTIAPGSTGDAAYYSRRYMNRASAVLKELLGAAAFTGLGSPCDDCLELAPSYEEARTALEDINLLKRDGGGNQAAMDRKPAVDAPSLTVRMPLIRGALENGGLNQAKSVVGEYLKKWSDTGSFTLGDADRALREFTILLQDMTLELGASADRGTRPAKNEGESGVYGGDYASFEEYESLLYRILELHYGDVARTSSGNAPEVLEQIKSYVDNRYYEDIKISVFTDKYFLSREYLMKLFKARYGYGIHEYVQKVRMDKAKELLGDPDLKIQEISEILGYRDKNYFSKAFRNYFDCSPTEYRSILPTAQK